MTDARWRFTTIAHAGRDLLGPLSEASVDALIARAPARGPGRVLDVGCGKGEMLVRALERRGGTGLGIEPNPAFAADARSRAAERLGPGRVRIEERAFAAEIVAGERFSLVICTGALHAFGNWDSALQGIAALVEPGGSALLGPGYWRRPPAPEYLASTGIREDELVSLADTLGRAESCGWSVVARHESTLDEWDGYEHAYAGSMRAWCETHANDPDAGPFRERIDRWADAYARWGRDTMGFCVVLLRRREA